MRRVIISTLLCLGLAMLTACGGGGGGSSSTSTPTSLDADSKSDLTTAYTSLETSERTAFTTILTNSDDAESQAVMTAMSDAAASGIDSDTIRAAHTASLSRAGGLSQLELYNLLIDAFAALRLSNATLFEAYTALLETLDDEELTAVVTVF